MRNITLSNGQETTVDDSDYEELCKYKWGTIKNKSGHIYAARGTRKNGKYSKILIHRVIMDNPENKMIDHINGNTLDNRRENLRIATRAKNLQNSKLRSDSKCNYKGVSKRGHRYIARIQISVDKRLFLGYFDNEKDAAMAYDLAANKYFGEFAKLNFKE